MITLLSALALGAAPTCTPVKDADTLWASRDTRWIFIGEQHGTNETPDAFTNLVCLAAAKRGPITVAIEWPIETQPLLDAWLASDGGERAKEALFAAPEWHYKDQAGFTSVAFLRMFERLRVLHKMGKVATVRAFDSPANGSDGRDRNIAMADRLTSIASATKGLTLVLVGNVHASRAPIAMGPEVIKPAAYLLPEKKRVTVGMQSPGGSSWMCRNDGCRIYDDGAGPSHPASLTWSKAPDRPFDVIYDLGVPYTAAVPAIPGVADQSISSAGTNKKP